MSLDTLEQHLSQLETLGRGQRIEALIAVAATLPDLAPRPEQPWEVVDRRQDHECLDIVTLYAHRHSDAVILAAEVGADVTTLTRALTALLVAHLSGETRQRILELSPSVVPRAIGESLLRQRSTSAYYPLRRIKEAVRELGIRE